MIVGSVNVSNEGHRYELVKDGLRGSEAFDNQRNFF